MMIETENLTKRYGDVTAVDGIDLAVERGSIHGFVGPNGAGKSTTMQLLVGLVKPTAGSVHIDGEPAGSHAALQTIGYAPQEPTFYESMTGRAYLRYMGRIAGLSAADARERAADLLSWLDLADAADQPIGGYSGGMARKLGLAQAMIHEPELLILDEPTATLDPEGRASVIDSLESLTDEGMTVFVSSHVLAELEQFIDTVTVLNEGQIVTSGPLSAIRETVDVERFRIDSSDNATLCERLTDIEVVDRVRRDDDGTLLIDATDGEAFTEAFHDVMGETDIMLRSMQQESDLEDAFLSLVEEGEG